MISKMTSVALSLACAVGTATDAADAAGISAEPPTIDPVELSPADYLARVVDPGKSVEIWEAFQAEFDALRQMV